jgi:putative ABC transport system substrate-binding protein
MIGRRDFITLLGGAVAWPLAAGAQQGERMRRIGVLIPGLENDPEMQLRVKAFRQALDKLGWHDDRNIRIEIRWGTGNIEQLRSYAGELVALAPDVILTGTNEATTILSRQTRSIPIVFAGVSDPLETGLITNMARPGGNITGFSRLEAAFAGKYLELLKEAAPHLTRMAVLYNRDSRVYPGYLRMIDAAARSFGVRTIILIAANDPSEVERAIAAFSLEADGGLIVLGGPPVNPHRELIITLAARYSLPAVYAERASVTNGGLMFYGPNIVERFELSASYVDRILKGEKPGDLPVQAPTKFELVINLKAAKAIGLKVPPLLLVRADEVIE